MNIENLTLEELEDLASNASVLLEQRRKEREELLNNTCSELFAQALPAIQNYNDMLPKGRKISVLSVVYEDGTSKNFQVN